MLRPTAIPEIPTETTRIARAAFPKGAPFLRLRDELGVFLTDQDFIDLYPRRGQPAAAPWRLMLISVMQYAENLTDRQAADAVRGHLAWTYALSLELDDPGLDASVLCEFRTRLLAAPEPLKWLDRLLSLCAERGLLQRHGKQRTDSTHVLAAIRVMNRLELITECLRAALNALAAVAPEWLRERAAPEWYDRYGHRLDNYRLPKSDSGKQLYADQVGKDGQLLLALLAREDAPQDSQHLSEVLTLERCWQRQCAGLDGTVRFRLRDELVKDRELQLESPYDPEARYSTKRGREWSGDTVHVSETCDDNLPHLITQVATTTAEVHDAPLGQQIQADLFRRDLQPTQHWVDAGYNAAELIVRAKEQHGTEIIGPVRPNTSQQEFPCRDLWRQQRRPKRWGVEIPWSRGPLCEVSLPRPSSLPLSIVTALLNRATSVSGIASYSTVRKSLLCQGLAQHSFTTNQDLQRPPKNAPCGAFLAIDFVMVPHAGLEMEGLNFHYSGQARTQLGHQFTSAALVKFGADPTPLLERFKVSRLLETAAYLYRTATQEMIHTVTQCREAGVSIAGVLLDGEFGRDEVVTFSHDTRIPVLVRAKRTMTVHVEGESLTLNALAQRFPPERCHLYAEVGWRVRRLPVSRDVGAFDVLIIWRKVHGEWSCFFLFSTVDPALTVRALVRAWKARWGIEVIHRLMKQNFALGRCRCRTIQAQDNWAWCVVEALHAVRLVRQEQPQLTWRAAQHRAAQHTELYVLTEVQPVPQQLHAA